MKRGFLCLGLAVALMSCAKGRVPSYGNSVCELPESPLSVDVRASSLPSRYQIAQKSSRIELTLFLEFIDEKQHMRFGIPDQGLRARAEQCLTEAQPFLSGPNGEEFSILLAPESAVAGSAAKRQIHVTSRPVRGHSTLWQAQWGCPQIMHEVFHLLGLVDEYAEATYSCRASGPTDSIMVDPNRAYYEVTQRRSRKSLLYPAQFRAIAYPGCTQPNQTYYACARNAYRSSDLGCSKIPTECSGPRTDWVNH